MEWLEDEDEDDDLREATRRYLPDTVIWTTDWTVGSLIDQLARNVFDAAPPFQRRYVWNDKKASLYIESLLVGCPVPALTLAELKANSPYQYVVIDGKQRLGSLQRWATGELKLTGLEILDSLNGATFDDVMAASVFQRVLNQPIRTVILRNWQEDDVLQFIFHRLNTQVTPLSSHELRRSLLPGPFTDYLDMRSARSTGVQRILGITEPDARLRDSELWLRALAFSEFADRYRGNLKQFLDQVTRKQNAAFERNRSDLERASDGIDMAINTAFEIFGDQAFQRLELSGEPTGRFNRAIFDMMVFSFRFDDVRTACEGRHQEIQEAFRSLNVDQTFQSYVAATTKRQDAVFGRIGMWLDILGSAIAIDGLGQRRPVAPLVK